MACRFCKVPGGQCLRIYGNGLAYFRGAAMAGYGAAGGLIYYYSRSEELELVMFFSILPPRFAEILRTQCT